MRIFKNVFIYLLWSVLSILFFLLFVGYAKTHWNLREYVDFLNARDRSVFSWSTPATRSDPFWPSTVTTSIEAIVASDDEVDASIFDPYDPSLEDELSSLPQSDISLEDDDFGFIAPDGAASSQPSTSSGSSTLQQLIKQRK